MTTTAKYTSKCQECGLRIQPGDTIEPGYRSFRHADCTMASVSRQVVELVAAGSTQAEIWSLLASTPNLSDAQKMDAIFLTRDS